MADENLKIIIDDGRRKVPIENFEGDEIGCFYFSPTDLGIVERFNEISSRFDSVIEPLQSVGIDAKGEGLDPESVALLKEAGKRLFDMVDYLFQGNASQAFFGKINPFSPIGGNFYCVSVLNTVSAFIEKQFSSETKRISKNLAKYTAKYAA